MGFAVVAAGIAFIGFACGPHTGQRSSLAGRLVLYVLSGLFVVHCWLSLLTLMHVPWSGVSIAVPLLASSLIVAVVRKRSPAGRATPFGFGDGIALLALAAFAICASRLWIVTSDFFYHWGVKGEKFFLARGLDLQYLSGPSSITGWYPTLVPELYALTALARGRFVEGEMMAWSTLWLFLIWLAVRVAVERIPLEQHVRQAGIGAVLAMCVAGGISIRLAGGADWIIALAFVAGASVLVEARSESDHLMLPIAAAVAAAAKTEGVALAAILLGLDLIRRLLSGPRRPAVRAWVVSLAPSVLVTALWIAQNTQAKLWPHGLSTMPSESHIREWLGTLKNQFIDGGATFHLPALLLLIPLLFLRPVTRLAGLALALQLAFYETVYLISPGSPAVYVRTTFGRLAFQLLPAAVVGLVALMSSETDAMHPAGNILSIQNRPARPDVATGLRA